MFLVGTQVNAMQSLLGEHLGLVRFSQVPCESPLPVHTGRNSPLQRMVGHLCTYPSHKAPLALQTVPSLASHAPVNREARKNALLHAG